MKTIEMGIGHSSGDGKGDCHIGGKVDGEAELENVTDMTDITV